MKMFMTSFIKQVPRVLLILSLFSVRVDYKNGQTEISASFSGLSEQPQTPTQTKK